MRRIQQATTTESLFLELGKWCQQGAGRKNDHLQIISAFASGPGVIALEPFFDVFLADGNRLEIIIGIDRGGTSRDAITRLFELQNAYSRRVMCSIFYAPSKAAIFHPKLYIYRTAATMSAVIGSANLTLGGLGGNFESIFLYDGISRKSNEATQINNVWNTFATPAAPLERTFLRPLTEEYAKDLVRKLPSSSHFESGSSPQGVRSLWKPLSQVDLPRSASPAREPQAVVKRRVSKFLIIDVLSETRETQMQIPLAVVEEFFGIDRHVAGEISLSQIRGGEITQPIQRNVVISAGEGAKRLMRRIEMPQIAAKARPLCAIFVKLRNGQFAVSIAPQDTALFKRLNPWLRDHCQQPQHAQRRYYIGSAGDSLLDVLVPELGLSALSRHHI